jgi:hypothetical protein
VPGGRRRKGATSTVRDVAKEACVTVTQAAKEIKQARLTVSFGHGHRCRGC